MNPIDMLDAEMRDRLAAKNAEIDRLRAELAEAKLDIDRIEMRLCDAGTTITQFKVRVERAETEVAALRTQLDQLAISVLNSNEGNLYPINVWNEINKIASAALAPSEK